MKIAKILFIAIATIALTSCFSKKSAPMETEIIEKTDSMSQNEFLSLVNITSEQKSPYVSSKVKFTLEVGPQRLNLTGNLRMKRDDVIRLQLMAFGFVEAGRMEFTKDYVLIVDRINKQYLKAPYKYIDFMRNSGVNFFTLQALFWNELFIPGQEGLKASDLKNFSADMGGDEAVIYLERGKINYSWLANQKTGRIKMTNIMYRDPYEGNSQLNWNYESYGLLNGKPFPNEMIVTLTTPSKEVKMGIKLNYMGTDSNWETRTNVSANYREVTAEELLKRVMSSL
jgi:hypothetical protein